MAGYRVKEFGSSGQRSANDVEAHGCGPLPSGKFKVRIHPDCRAFGARWVWQDLAIFGRSGKWLSKVCVNALIRAYNLRGLLLARDPGYPGCRPWALLWPLANPFFHDAEGAHQVDSLSAGQIGALPPPQERAAGGDAKWMARIAGLLAYQFHDVRQTKALSLAWGHHDLVAVVGVASENSFPEIQDLADDYAEALVRIHRWQSVLQETAALRYLMERWRQPLIIVRNDAGIVAATDAGWDALYSFLGRRPVKKNPVVTLPSVLATALGRAGTTDLGKQEMTVEVFPDLVRELIAPLFTVSLTAKLENRGENSLEEKLMTLTPAQRETYHLLIKGDRNKEIAAKLGVSIHTIIHHVGGILAKLGYQDRLQVIAAARTNTENVIKVPPVLAGPVVPNHPLPKKVNKGTA